MNKVPPQGIVFDKDGTLFDFARTWEAWAKSTLLQVAQDIAHARLIGKTIGFDVDAETFAPDSIVIAGAPDEVAAAILPHLHGYTMSRLIDVMNEEAARAPQVAVTALVPFLENLKSRGLMVGVATNDAETPARAHLDSVGATDLFDFIAGYDSGHGAKPGPGQLQAFCAQTGLSPSVCVMVGDSRHDLRAGRAAGFRTIGVLTGLAARGDLVDLADVVLQDISEIPAWLDQQ